MIVAGSAPVLAESSANKMSGIIYTAEDPGIWAKKVGSHAPKINIEGGEVQITTEHPMTEKHYIVRHTLVSLDGKVLGSKTFYPDDEDVVSSYEFPPDATGKFYATSFCNKHDFWMTEFSV